MRTDEGIKMPDFNKAFEYENDFYLSCVQQRIGKMITHYELFKRAMTVDGEIVECGLFKGVSFVRFAHFRKLLGEDARGMIGFDVFGEFPETAFELDKALRQSYCDAAGSLSISEKQLMNVLEHKNLENGINLVKGDICETVPAFVKLHPELKIAFLNLDVDIYEPSVVILEHLWKLIVPGGILVLDDYKKFPGETKAVDEFFKDKNVKIENLGYSDTPHYIIKEYEDEN